MITKDQLAAALQRECDICIHLHGKLAPAALEWRPTPAQRTTLELLRYLTACGIGGIRSMAENNWQVFGEYTARAEAMRGEDFPALMRRQHDEIADWFTATPVETLTTREGKLPGGGVMPLGAAIMHGPLKWLTAYKMQLFLYAKANGAAIGTVNAWAGMDQPPR